MNAGLAIVSFVVLICIIGMGSILISMILDSDVVEYVRYVEDEPKQKKTDDTTMNFLYQESEDQETYGVIIIED